MSISAEIDRIRAAKNDLAAALLEKGVAVPEGASISDFGSYVRQIKTGASVYSAEFTAAQWTGDAAPYQLTIPAGDRDAGAPLLCQVESQVSGGYSRSTWNAISTSVAFNEASRSLILSAYSKFSGRVVYL